MKTGIIGLGNGRLSGACQTGDECIVFIRRGGALHRLVCSADGTVTDGGVAGYENDRYEFPVGVLGFGKEVKFEIKD